MMNLKTLAGTVVAGTVLTAAAVGAVSAQSTGEAPAVSEARAIEIALAEVPGTVKETELEREDGTQVYEIEILTADGVEMEVEIDAASGKILDVDREDDDDDDDKRDG